MMHSVILAARRSPVAPRNGAFASFEIEDLAAPVILAALADAGINPDAVGELIVSNALGAGGNPGRIAALKSGMPERVAGLTIDRQCVGGLDAILLADALIRSGQADIVVAGGAESYSRAPVRFRTFADGRPPEKYQQARFTPWPDQDPDMAQAADVLARSLQISKSDQDAWAINSHAKGLASPQSGLVPLGGIKRDTFTRNLTPALCGRAKTIYGTITSANMSVAADGAAFVVMASSQWAAARRATGVRVLGGQTLGGDPTMPGLAPVAAIKQVLAQTQSRVTDLTSAEIMEAFAVQAIACVNGTGLDPAIVNKRGGSLARGHPIGASGAILAVELFEQLRGTKDKGLAAIAAAGGLGTAVLFSGAP